MAGFCLIYLHTQILAQCLEHGGCPMCTERTLSLLPISYSIVRRAGMETTGLWKRRGGGGLGDSLVWPWAASAAGGQGWEGLRGKRVR